MLTVSSFSSAMPANVSLVSFGHSPLHTHKYIQIFYVLDGEIDLTLSFSRYVLKPGDVFVVHYGDIHSVSGIKGQNHVVLLDINTDYFKQDYPGLENRFFVSYLMQSKGEDSRFQEISRLIEETVVHFANEGESQAEKTAELCRRCIECFYANFLGFSLNKELKTFESKISSKPFQMLRVSNAIASIYENYNTKLTLDDVAQTLHIDKFYLSHLIKGLTGESFQNLLGMARSEYSEELLLATSMSIYEIALEVGFSNVTYYEKHFVKWYEMTPEEYRTQYAPKTILNSESDHTSFPLTPETLSTFENFFHVAGSTQVVEIELNGTSRVGPEELSLFYEGFQRYGDNLKQTEDAFGDTPVLKTPSYYLNYYFSRLMPIRADTGPTFVACRSGKDHNLILYSPMDGKDYDVAIQLPDSQSTRRVLEYKIDPTNSVLNYWQLLGAPKRVDPEEMRAIEAATHPRLIIAMLPEGEAQSYRTTIRQGTASYIFIKQA